MGRAAGQHAAGFQRESALPQRPEQLRRVGQVLLAEQDMPHAAEQIGHQQRADRPHGHRPPSVVPLNPAHAQQGRYAQKESGAQQPLHHLGHSGDQPAVRCKVAYQHAQRQQQADNSRHFPADRRLCALCAAAIAALTAALCARRCCAAPAAGFSLRAPCAGCGFLLCRCHGIPSYFSLTCSAIRRSNSAWWSKKRSLTGAVNSSVRTNCLNSS